MLYYAPQAWTSDDTDAIERLKIQYGTSLCYPLSSIGSHVSAVPNHQTGRFTPLRTRGAAALFGTFGYELDLEKLTEEETAEVKAQVSFMKKYRDLIQTGDFYRLKSPFEGNETAWQVVSRDKKTAIAAYFRTLNEPNAPFSRVYPRALNPDFLYTLEDVFLQEKNKFYGDELMNAGLIISSCEKGDFASKIYIFKAEETKQ